MTKSNLKKLTVEEKRVFEAAMEDVDKISPRKVKYFHHVVSVSDKRAREARKPIIAKQCKHPLSDLSSGLSVDVDRKTLLRLKRGQLRPETRLDLHGMSQSEAFTSLVHFVIHAHQCRFRCVLAITGKGNVKQGGGVLRNQFPNWLNSRELRPYVLGFSEAQPRDGGGGAFYILVRRKRS